MNDVDTLMREYLRECTPDEVTLRELVPTSSSTRVRRSPRALVPILASVTAAALLVVGVVIAREQLAGSDASPENRSSDPMSSETPPQTWPMYRDGYKLREFAEDSNPAGSIFTFTAPEQAFEMAWTCAGPPDAPRGETFINGIPAYEVEGDCAALEEYDKGLAGVVFDSPEGRSIEPGETVTIEQRWLDGQAHEGSRWLTGLYVKVPISEYEFVEGSPADIEPVPADEFSGPCATVMESPGEGTFSCQLKLDANFQWHVFSSAPGKLRVKINGEYVDARFHVIWNYGRESWSALQGLREYNLELEDNLKPGETVTAAAEWTPFTDDESEVGIAFSSGSDALNK